MKRRMFRFEQHEDFPLLLVLREGSCGFAPPTTAVIRKADGNF